MMISINVAMLITLEDKQYANMTIPGKVQSYIAVGKPIIGAINGSTANFIINNEIGYVCASMNSDALATLIKNLKLEELEAIGKHSKDVYFKEYSKKLFINKLLLELEKLAK